MAMLRIREPESVELAGLAGFGGKKHEPTSEQGRKLMAAAKWLVTHRRCPAGLDSIRLTWTTSVLRRSTRS